MEHKQIYDVRKQTKNNVYQSQIIGAHIAKKTKDDKNRTIL